MSQDDVSNIPTTADRLINQSNFETSPLRFEYDALIEEYKATRAELLLRLQMGQQIVNFSIAFAVGSLAILQILINSNFGTSLTEFITRYGYLLASVVSSSFALMYLETVRKGF